MKLNILSDLHILPSEGYLVSPPEADVYILAGDIHLGGESISWIKQNYPKNKPILYVAGNHEFYHTSIPKEIEDTEKEVKETNIHFLNNSMVKIGDINFIGSTLWTDFMLFGQWHKPYSEIACSTAINDFRYIKFLKDKKLTTFHTTVMFKEAKEYLIKQLTNLRYEKVVVVTHHAPSRKSLAPKYKDDEVSSGFVSTLLDDIPKGIEPLLWVHGHTHTYFDYKLKTTRVVCNPRGNIYENIQEFNPNLIVEV